MTEVANGMVANGHANGGSADKPPDIEHVTNNIISLQTILRYYTTEAYKQLTTVIENLASKKDSEVDVKRKWSFLQQIIAIREDFVKLYALVKWSANANDIGKLIDLLNWFRMQDFHFDQLAFQTNSLNSFGGAKLPDSDIHTALEVLIEGRPQLPSYNYIPASKISPKKILEVLHNLNLVLTTRMAILDNIPQRFLNSYHIQDGRIFFTISNEFQVAVTVANDLILSSDADYSQSPFYFVDFQFLFGINPDTQLITHRDNKIVTRLPRSSHERLEKVANHVLSTSGLPGLYDLLHKYSISFKLYLIAKQLRELSINSKWRGNIQFNYRNGGALIIINYWCSQAFSRNWRSYIELGIDRNYNLNFRWFKNGRYVLDHGINGIYSRDMAGGERMTRSTSTSPSLDPEAVEDEDPGDISVDLILNIIANKHSEMLMSSIFNELQTNFARVPGASSYIQWITPCQLQLSLSPNVSTVFAINPLTGLFYFVEPTPLQDKATKLINTLSPSSSKKFVSEEETVGKIVSVLLQLRLDSYSAEVNRKLLTTDWISNEIIQLTETERSQLVIESKAGSKIRTKIQFYRRKNWPSSCFMINMITGLSSKTYWWVARIKSIKGDWKIQWLDKISFDKNIIEPATVKELEVKVETRSASLQANLSENIGVEASKLSYRWLNDLATVCINIIIDHTLLEELRNRNMRYVTGTNVRDFMSKMGIVEKLPAVDAAQGEKPITYESVVVIHNSGDLLPIQVSTNCLFLKVKLVSIGGVTSMYLKLFGSLSLSLKIPPPNSAAINLSINETSFEISEEIDLTSRMNSEQSAAPSVSLLDPIFNRLNKLNQFINILHQLDKNNIEVVENSLDKIVICLGVGVSHYIQVNMPNSPQESVSFSVQGASVARDEISVVLNYINDYIKSHSSKDSVLWGVVRYLKEVTPILRSITSVREKIIAAKEIIRGPNRMPLLMFDVKFPTLSMIQFVFQINHWTQGKPPKLTKDKIVINLSFRQNKFAKHPLNLINVSLKDNINPENLKYKGLFELIFKSINSVEAPKDGPPMIKLNCDFLVNPATVDEMMKKIFECFIVYLRGEAVH